MRTTLLRSLHLRDAFPITNTTLGKPGQDAEGIGSRAVAKGTGYFRAIRFARTLFVRILFVRTLSRSLPE
jgi:hypothetical protein